MDDRVNGKAASRPGVPTPSLTGRVPPRSPRASVSVPAILVFTILCVRFDSQAAPNDPSRKQPHGSSISHKQARQKGLGHGASVLGPLAGKTRWRTSGARTQLMQHLSFSQQGLRAALTFVPGSEERVCRANRLVSPGAAGCVGNKASQDQLPSRPGTGHAVHWPEKLPQTGLPLCPAPKSSSDSQVHPNLFS